MMLHWVKFIMVNGDSGASAGKVWEIHLNEFPNSSGYCTDRDGPTDLLGIVTNYQGDNANNTPYAMMRPEDVNGRNMTVEIRDAIDKKTDTRTPITNNWVLQMVLLNF